MSVVSRLGNEGPMNRDSIPGGGQRPVHPSVDPPTVLYSDCWALVPWG